MSYLLEVSEIYWGEKLSDYNWGAVPFACDPVCCHDLCPLSDGLGESEHWNAERCYLQTMQVKTFYIILKQCSFVFFFFSCTAEAWGSTLTPSKQSLTDVSRDNSRYEVITKANDNQKQPFLQAAFLRINILKESIRLSVQPLKGLREYLCQHLPYKTLPGV